MSIDFLLLHILKSCRSRLLSPPELSLHLCPLRLETLNSKSIDSKSTSFPTFKSTASFLSRFTDLKCSIEARIAQCQLSHTSDATQLKPQLGSISSLISDLEKLVAENSYFLPSYEVRSLLKAIFDLKQSLEDLSLELVPKKKFSFKNKVAKKDPSLIPKWRKKNRKKLRKWVLQFRIHLGFETKQEKFCQAIKETNIKKRLL